MFGTGIFAPIYQRLFGAKLAASVTTNAAPAADFTMNLDITEAIQRAMANGSYELQQTSWATSILKSGSRFVDIGASFGHYTALASRLVGPTGKVFSFEPSPVAARSIAQFIKTNAVQNVQLIRAAVGDRDGEIDIYLPGENAVVHSPSALVSDPTFTPCKVSVIALDNFKTLHDGRPIDLMKIDVEGFEPNVVAGMNKLARSGAIRNLMCEFNTGWLRRNNATADSLLSSIVDLGFIVSDQTESETHLESDGVTPYRLQDMLFRMKGI